MTSIATVDSRPYFERALCHARAEGLVDAARLEAIQREGAKGIVQLAAYFSTANLRPELEAARTRLVTLVGLALEAESGGKLDVAARLLRDKTLLALSKAGADRLRRLHALPTAPDLLGAIEISPESEKEFLDQCTTEPVITYARYLAEHAKRERNQHYIDATCWLAERLGVARGDIQEWHATCEQAINSALLVLFAEKKPGGFFSFNRFVKLSNAAAKKRSSNFGPLETWLADAPPTIRRVIERECARFNAKVLPLLREQPATEFYPHEDEEGRKGHHSSLFSFDTASLGEITHHDKARAEEWQHITGTQGEHVDVQCGVLLMVACGLEPARSLRKKDAQAIWEAFSAGGFDAAAVARFIDNVVPFEYQADIRRMWDEDLGPEARVHLDSDDETRVLDYLQETCRASWKKRAS